VAEEKGYYAVENLTVSLHPYDFEKPLDPIEQIVMGKAQFATANAGSVLLARAEGKPIVAIATLYQRNPSVLVSLAEKNITRPQDLVGKKVMIDTSSTDSIIYTAMFASQPDLDLEQINIIPRTDFSNNLLINGEVDVMDAFINNQPVQLEKEGYKVNMIIPANYGFDIYANVIITSEEMITEHPDLVEGFVRATVRGIQSAIDDPKGATTLTVARNKEINFESELESMNRSLPLFNPTGSRPGMMTSEIWTSTYQILVEQNILTKSIEVEKAYTLTFLDKIYSQ
jgi:NitT/TauT family transport system substrate-binding protein